MHSLQSSIQSTWSPHPFPHIFPSLITPLKPPNRCSLKTKHAKNINQNLISCSCNYHFIFSQPFKPSLHSQMAYLLTHLSLILQLSGEGGESPLTLKRNEWNQGLKETLYPLSNSNFQKSGGKNQLQLQGAAQPQGDGQVIYMCVYIYIKLIKWQKQGRQPSATAQRMQGFGFHSRKMKIIWFRPTMRTRAIEKQGSFA